MPSCYFMPGPVLGTLHKSSLVAFVITSEALGSLIKKRRFSEAGDRAQDARSSESGLQSQTYWSPKLMLC